MFWKLLIYLSAMNFQKISSAKVGDEEASITKRMIQNLELYNDIIEIELLDRDGEMENLQKASFNLNWILMRSNAILQNSIIQMPAEIELNALKKNLAHEMQIINDIYVIARKYMLEGLPDSKIELKRIEREFTQRNYEDLRHSVLRIHHEIVPNATRHVKDHFLDLFIQHTQAKGATLCGKQSPNHYLRNLFAAVIDAENQGHTAITFHYSVQHALHEVNTDIEWRRAEEHHQQRLLNYLTQFRKYLAQASTILRPCDPIKLTRDVTFIEMEKLYKAVEFRDHQVTSDGVCLEKCRDIDRRNFNHSLRFFSCRRLHECQNYEVLRACLLPKSNSRVYEWIGERSGIINGRTDGDDSCSGIEVLSSTKIARYDTCPSCICTCEGADASATREGVQAFSLRVSRSAVEDNMVITGVRFARRKTIVCIDIKQGKLLPGATIDQDSEHWSECDIDFLTYQDVKFGRSKAYLSDIDYHVIASENNFVDLDDLTMANYYVVTGIRFALSAACEDKNHIQLRLEYMKYRFLSGELISKKMNHASSACHRKRANIAEARSPLHEEFPRTPNIPSSHENSYIQFGMSDFGTDAGQTTLPLLDAGKVQSDPSVPLFGIGLFYKSSPGYGGFLAFRIHTFNYTEYIFGLDMI